MDTATTQSDKLVVRGSWVIPAERSAVYAIASDFARLPERFPKLAHSAQIVRRDGNRLSINVEAASFGRLFPRVKVSIEAELIPDRGYRCVTHNRTFNTTGQEELLLYDDPGGTRLEYAYTVTVKYRRLRPLYGWLVRRFALRFWEHNYLTPLTGHARCYRPDQATADRTPAGGFAAPGPALMTPAGPEPATSRSKDGSSAD